MRTENPCFKKRTGVNSDPVALDNLRLETSADCFYLLPYHHVELVKFESAPDNDLITMFCLNRTVRIAGKKLRDLGIALQHRHIEFIKPVPERYASLSPDEDGLVKSIEILEQKRDGHA